MKQKSCTSTIHCIIRFLFVFCIFNFVLIVSTSCSDTNSPQTDIQIETKSDDETDSDPDSELDSISLVDRTGKRWDITHAVNTYDMDPELFRFGLGPNAIEPLNNPEFISPGDREFPVSTGQFQIIGVNIDDEQRAYPISVVVRYEIVNDNVNENSFSAVY
jgi:hypothetical protein